jgi:polyhydroxybutyrate depolymerase
MRALLMVAAPGVALAVAVAGLMVVRAGREQPTRAHYAPLVRAVAKAPAATPAPAPAPAPTAAAPVVSVNTLLVDGRARQWQRLTPGGGVTATTPILVVLHGQAVTAAQEVGRDGLTPLVAAGRAELAYPQGIGNSWNAGGCCGAAQTQKVDDVGFVRALVAEVDPGRTRPVFLIGYSNGGRLAYTVACQDPTLVDGFAIVDAVPMSGCTLGRPITILQVDGTADPVIPYRPGDPGGELPPATTQVERLRLLDGCAAAPSTVQTGNLAVATWSGCVDGTRLAFASYQGGNHWWPTGDAITPSAGRTIWTFVSQGQPW